MRRSFSIALLGFRGFPGIQGGVETHAEHLCPLLAALGCDVEVIVRSPYQSSEIHFEWKGVRFRRLWAPKYKSLEAITHSLLGVLYAGFISRPDILHIQAIGPALVAPLARMLGLNVVVTHHGPDYDRQKWGSFARLVLKLGECWGMRCANARIVISKSILELVKNKYGEDSVLIQNGVALTEIPNTQQALTDFGLTPYRYILLVSRLVPEKRHHDLIDAFKIIQLDGWQLVLVGASDHPDAYVRSVLAAAKATPNVITTDFQTGLALRELYAYAGLFVLPSSHEGLPIALLEALSFGLPVLASAIPANLELDLSESSYFELGNIGELAEKLLILARQDINLKKRNLTRSAIADKFNWLKIAEQTILVYRSVLEKNKTFL